MFDSAVMFVAGLLGASESATRLLLSLLSGYPLAMLYRSPLLYNQPAPVKHVYFIITGLLQCCFNFGTEVYHSLINIAIIYIVLRLAGGTKASVVFAFVFNTGYLVGGYCFETSGVNSYNISWTMPHCVLTLRLTAVAFDLYDGQKKPIPPESRDSSLIKCPSLLELLGQCYFFGGFLVGPQYCMQRYLNFVHGVYSDPRTKGPPNTTPAALERFFLGIVYIGAFQVVVMFVSDDYLQSSAFQERGLLFKCVVLMLWGKTCLNKYIGSWLLTEGAIIYCGLSYRDVDNNNVAQWDACTNVRLQHLESACTLYHYIQSFNCNTNLWMAKYIFKRLRFLGNKMVSQCVTLLYLAVWHGLDTGYYVCFFLEFVYMFCERQVSETVGRVEGLNSWLSRPELQPVVYVVKKVYSTFLLSWALVAFSLLHTRKWSSVYASLHYVGFVIPLVVVAASVLLRRLLPKPVAHNGLAASSSSSATARSSEKTD
ncbi:lysophospholipid acyltransferase 5-like [Babylonia areolata]|uniref:lysophospholipid acyltransferase 5-like n=1 Tax=Babylonia areolata TaxID=304850 RepID=UPI003FCF97B3